MKNILYTIFGIVMLVAFSACTLTKTTADLEKERLELINKLDAKRFTFETNYVISSGGFQPKYLTTTYDLTITPDSLKSYLPYFGVAYNSSDFGSNRSPLIFTSTNFEYNKTYNEKNRSWIINIEVNNGQRLISYTLTLYENGKGDLIVFDTSRQRITFRGGIKLSD